MNAHSLPIMISLDAPESKSVQIAAEIRRLVGNGALTPEQPIPSSRALAAQLGVSRGTVVSAYDQLVAESYLVSTPGGKTRIHPGASATHVAAHHASARDAAGTDGNRRKYAGPETQLDVTPRVHPPVIIDDSSWREAWRAAAAPSFVPAEAHGYSTVSDGVQGLASLREAIAEHLRLMRSMLVDPADIFVTTGARDGLALLLSANGDAMHEVGVESPGYPGLRRVLARFGVRAVDLPVDSDGLMASALPAKLGAILVTPNNLYPVGGSMPAPRRFELLARAQEQNLLVIEDDVDSEYRHVGAVLPSLWELAPQSVAHLGTFNQVLTPDVRLGYLIAPRGLHSGLVAARADLGSGASAIAQRAVATYLRGGGLRRQLIRRRREVVRRRDVVFRILGDFGVQMNAGAIAIIELTSQRASDLVRERCERDGLLVGDLAAYWSQPAQAPASGIVIAYGDVPENELGPALELVAAAIGETQAFQASFKE